MLSGRSLSENKADVYMYHLCYRQVEKDLQDQLMYFWKGAKHVETLNQLNDGKEA